METEDKITLIKFIDVKEQEEKRFKMWNYFIDSIRKAAGINIEIERIDKLTVITSSLDHLVQRVTSDYKISILNYSNILLHDVSPECIDVALVLMEKLAKAVYSWKKEEKK